MNTALETSTYTVKYSLLSNNGKACGNSQKRDALFNRLGVIMTSLTQLVCWQSFFCLTLKEYKVAKDNISDPGYDGGYLDLWLFLTRVDGG